MSAGFNAIYLLSLTVHHRLGNEVISTINTMVLSRKWDQIGIEGSGSKTELYVAYSSSVLYHQALSIDGEQYGVASCRKLRLKLTKASCVLNH